MLRVGKRSQMLDKKMIDRMLKYFEVQCVDVEDEIYNALESDEEYIDNILGLKYDIDKVKELGEFIGYLKGIKNGKNCG